MGMRTSFIFMTDGDEAVEHLLVPCTLKHVSVAPSLSSAGSGGVDLAGNLNRLPQRDIARNALATRDHVLRLPSPGDENVESKLCMWLLPYELEALSSKDAETVLRRWLNQVQLEEPVESCESSLDEPA